MNLIRKLTVLSLLNCGVIAGLLANFALASPELKAGKGPSSKHSLSRFCWPTVVDGPTGKPEDQIQDRLMGLSFEGEQAKLDFVLPHPPKGSSCRKTLEGTVSFLPTIISFRSIKLTCDERLIEIKHLEKPIALINAISDEQGSRVFGVQDEDHVLGLCKKSKLLITIDPIIY